MTFLRLLYECLLDYGEGTDLVPWLAEEVPAPPADGKTWTFHIKKNVHFTSGRELEASDFVYSLERVLDPKTKSPGDGYYRNIRGAEEFQKARSQEAEEAKADADKRVRREKGERWLAPTGVAGLQAVGRYTLTIELDKPDPAFLYLMTMPFSAPVARESVEKYDKEFFRNPDGTGPYVLSEWRRGARICFTRKPEHHMHREKSIAALDVLIGPDDLTMQMMFERGQLDLNFTISPPDFIRVCNDPHWKKCVGSISLNETDYLAMNCEIAPFNNPLVRRALNHAVNKERILKLMNFRGTIARGVLPPNIPGYNPNLKGYDYDPAKAKQLLAEAGYPNGFRMPLWVIADTDYRVKIGQSVQQDLKEVGIEVDLKPVAYAVFDEATGKRKEVAASIFGWSQDYPDASDFLDVLFNSERISDEHCNNLAFYADPKLDELLKAAAAETRDPARRLRIYREAEEKVVRDAPWVFLYHPIDYRLVQPWVKGFKMHSVWLVRFEKLWMERP